jgi:hypothetical protein
MADTGSAGPLTEDTHRVSQESNSETLAILRELRDEQRSLRDELSVTKTELDKRLDRHFGDEEVSDGADESADADSGSASRRQSGAAVKRSGRGRPRGSKNRRPKKPSEAAESGKGAKKSPRAKVRTRSAAAAESCKNVACLGA